MDFELFGDKEGTDLDVIKSKYKIPVNVPIILFMARINKKKGTDMLIEAFKLIDPGLKAHLIISGPDDGQLREVQTLIKNFKLENRIIFTGITFSSRCYGNL